MSQQTTNPWQPQQEPPRYAPPQPPMMTPAEFQRKQDDEHLNLLAIGHYVLGGLTALGSCVFLVHFFLGLAMVTNPHSFDGPKSTPSSGGPPPAFLGYMFMGIGGGAVALGWLLGGLTIYAGLCIARRRAPVFCQVIAGLNCLHMPLGTALGVFTLIVLNRPSVKALFAGIPVALPTAETANWYRDGNGVG